MLWENMLMMVILYLCKRFHLNQLSAAPWINQLLQTYDLSIFLQHLYVVFIHILKVVFTVYNCCFYSNIRALSRPGICEKLDCLNMGICTFCMVLFAASTRCFYSMYLLLNVQIYCCKTHPQHRAGFPARL